ncbi:hypothetical protein SAY87_008336 [Trapa incisa]|uniref:Cyclin-like domain-containing protein n=1 Tax=Trapa incisa TaxID=236973 RepID=A0AAN7KKC4_9MYRT|nr:hypothetical protein SAY87_008336 [Trapa incisa]
MARNNDLESSLSQEIEDAGGSGGRWYLSRKEIEENSPSRGDGVDLKKEIYLRKSYCTFLQDLGMRLKVPQVTIATAIIFCHRFFLRQSHTRNDRRTIATVCMFLAGKVEETPRPLKDVILVSYEIIHKKDPTAAQRIKQKEVYEQQKELILSGERVVLATLSFDLNIYHPYKPLVEAIKKFKVAQNTLAQVAWNFVNDGLRTSLCLQFKPHHIAAGAIFLAAKFLKVKLPSDGEKVWWQEFTVTPRQLEEVSNQMLELYEQHKVPVSQGSEVERSMVGGGESVQSKGSSFHEGQVLKQASSRAPLDHSLTESHGVLRSTLKQSNEQERIEMSSVITDHRADAKLKEDIQHNHLEHVPAKENTKELINRSREHADIECDHDRNEKRNQPGEAVEWAEDDTFRKSENVPSRHLEFRSGSAGQSPKEPLKIDKDKVKAALEKRRKARTEITKKDVMDDDDLIERELEDGIELAAGDTKGQERRLSWPKSGESKFPKGQLARNAQTEHPEEGEMFEEASSVAKSHKRKGSPLERQTDKRRFQDYS